jgi:sensor domain CHASE-containing protein
MTGHLNKREWLVFVVALALLVLCSLRQNQQLRAAQLEEKKALYAERLRTAQVILENEMLAAAYLTSSDARTRERARHHLERSPR